MAIMLKEKINMIRAHATKQEKVLIEFLDNHKFSELILLSIIEFSEQAAVSEATMLRFCRKLGLKGFSEFRLLLAQDSGTDNLPKEENFASKIANEMCLAIRSTFDLICLESVNLAAKAMVKAKRIFSVGSGNSGVAAQELRNKLMRIGIIANHITDDHFQAIMLSTVTADDVVVLFSVSGATLNMIDLAQAVKKRGAKIVVVTSYAKSPLAVNADYLLTVVSRDAPLDGGSLITKVSQLYVINLISEAICSSLGNAAVANMEITAQSVVKKSI